MADPAFDLDFQPAYGEAVPVSPLIQRITVNNPSAFTFHGTNSYIVGDRSVAVIDPGPEDEAHFQALMAALDGREVTHIFVSHTHRDHSPLARRLKQATGALTVAEGPHRAARPLHVGETNPFAESSDTAFVPDIALGDGQSLSGDGWRLTALHTPGHTANHAAFALDGSGIVFSADHVMAWATTIVAPPDGAMSDYMASLERLLTRDDRLFLPTGDAGVAFLDCRDIAAAGHALLLSPDAAPHRGAAFELTGPEAVTAARMAEILGAIRGAPVRHIDGMEAFAARQAEVGAPTGFQNVYGEAAGSWFAALSTERFEAITGRRPRSFAAYADDRAPFFRS